MDYPSKQREFTLYAQVPASRHTQVLNILAGVTASQPGPIADQRLIYQRLKHLEPFPSRKPLANQQTSQAPRLTYVNLIRDVTKRRKGNKWMFRSEELPEPGVRNVIVRSVEEMEVGKEDLERFRGGSEWNT